MIGNKKVLPYIMIASDNYATLTYLEYLKYYGFSLKKIIYIQNNRNRKVFDFSPSRKKIAKILTSFFEVKINYDIEKIDYSNYCEEVLEVKVLNEYDKNLYKIIEENKDETYFFSYVGRVPKEFLDLTNFIHIHPGIMPEIRGTDCLFWSLAIRSKVGATMFYLNSGIDDGEIIYQNEYDMKPFNLNKLGSTKEIYKGILDFYDCNIRAKVLIEAINKKMIKKPNKEISHHKNDEGRQYFSMHEEVLSNILFKYFGVKYDK